jgi:trans-aconitate 2-methyltransferase
MKSGQRTDGARRKRIPEQWRRLGSKPLSPATYSWDPETYDRVSAGQRSFTGEPIRALDLTGVKRVIDLGCGTGWLAAELAARLPDAEVIGLDVSPAMIAYARKQWARQKNCRFVVADARRFRVKEPVDLIVSTAALHWIREQDRVLRNCALTVKDGGMIISDLAGSQNARALRRSLTSIMLSTKWKRYFAGFDDPFNFPTVERIAGSMVSSGIQVSSICVYRTFLNFEATEDLSAWIKAVWLPFVYAVPIALRGVFADEIAHSYQDSTVEMERIRISARVTRSRSA